MPEGPAREGGARRSPALGYALLAPSLAMLALLAIALGALLRFSVVEFIPGSIQTGGLTTQNFRGVLAPHYLRYIADTIVLSALTTVLTLAASYPVAYALAFAVGCICRWPRRCPSSLAACCAARWIAPGN